MNIGYIQTNALPGECDEAFQRIRDMIRQARVYFPTPEITGFIESESPPEDHTKLWLQADDCGKRWKYWSEDCDKWCPVGSIPGTQITRYRLADTVAEDIEEYYGCGWKLADGEEHDVDLRSVSNKSIYAIAFTKG